MEYCWLIIGVCALSVGVQNVIYIGINRNVAMYFVVAALSIAMFVYRRKKRKKIMQEL
jgi:Flp pilus assembly protein TadB